MFSSSLAYCAASVFLSLWCGFARAIFNDVIKLTKKFIMYYSINKLDKPRRLYCNVRNFHVHRDHPNHYMYSHVWFSRLNVSLGLYWFKIRSYYKAHMIFHHLLFYTWFLSGCLDRAIFLNAFLIVSAPAFGGTP